MILATLVGALLQFAVGLDSALLWCLLCGLLVAQFLAPGSRSCGLPRRD